MASSHDDRAGAENSASDEENGEKGISSNPKGFFHILSCQFVDGLTREPHHSLELYALFNYNSKYHEQLILESWFSDYGLDQSLLV